MPSAHPNPTRFTTYPLVLGRLGPHHDRAWNDFTRDPAAPLRTVISDDGVALAASQAPRFEKVTQRAWCWGRVVHERRRPTSAPDAAQELLLAGLWATEHSVTLHTDLFGLNDVFYRVLDGTTYFSNRLEPLTRLGGDLTMDLASWGATYGLYGFVAETSPFQEIKRLRFGESLVWQDRRVEVRRTLPRWLTDPGEEADIPDLIEALRAALPPRTMRRHQITLSGGWDSRMIALGMAAQRSRRPWAWSTDNDDGFQDDIQLARSVALGLGLRHTVVLPPAQAFLASRRETLQRTEYLTWLHTWLTPLAGRVRSPIPLLDGLGGDVLFKDEAGKAAAGGSDADHQTELLWRNMGCHRITAAGILRPDIADAWKESSLALVRQDQGLWAGHPAEFCLRRLLLRNARVIGTSPLRLFAPETPVLLPFLHPTFVRTLIAVPPHRKYDGQLTREVLYALDPVVGALRSTNDRPRSRPTARPRQQARPRVLQRLRKKVLSDETVVDLLHPDLIRRVSRPRGRSLEDVSPVLTWASALVDWRRDHAGVLGEPRLDSDDSALVDQASR